MIGLDTNVLVRYIMQDDARRSPLRSRSAESDARIFRQACARIQAAQEGRAR
jgi:predicted nucleic-acid-binding protein